MVFGVEFHNDGGREFMAIAAHTEQEAIEILTELGYNRFTVCNLEEVLREQYDQMAVLQTI